MCDHLPGSTLARGDPVVSLAERLVGGAGEKRVEIGPGEHLLAALRRRLLDVADRGLGDVPLPLRPGERRASSASLISGSFFTISAPHRWHQFEFGAGTVADVSL